MEMQNSTIQNQMLSDEIDNDETKNGTTEVEYAQDCTRDNSAMSEKDELQAFLLRAKLSDMKFRPASLHILSNGMFFTSFILG